MKEIILWGGTGQAIVVEDFLSNLGYKVVAIFDNDKSVKSPFKGISIFHGINGFNEWASKANVKEIGFLVSIGGDKGKDRIALSKFLISQSLTPISAIHPSAFLSHSIKKGVGVQILANACISARSVIGDYSIINTSVSIDHQCVIGEGTHIGPGTNLAGCVSIGKNTFIGTGSVILPRISIGSDTIVGAGAVVTKDLPDKVIAYGVPAKIIKNNID